jgi:predicted dehydrogenase
MTPAGPLPLILVGCGRLAELGYAPALAGQERLPVAAVVDPDRERRELLADATGAAAFAELPEAIESVSAGAAIVCSPPSEHLRAARLLADAGLPALVEKPPAPDAEGAAALCALDPPPWIGFNRRFALGAAPLAAGEDRLEIEIAYRRRSWRPLGSLGDAWGDLGPHAVDLALLLAGAGEASVREAELSEASASVELEAGDVVARLELRTDAPHRERIRAGREEGGLRTLAATPGPVRAAAARLRGREHPLVASLRAQVEAFARAVAGEPSAPLAGAADGARVMAVVDAARELAR